MADVRLLHPGFVLLSLPGSFPIRQAYTDRYASQHKKLIKFQSLIILSRYLCGSKLATDVIELGRRALNLQLGVLAEGLAETAVSILEKRLLVLVDPVVSDFEFLPFLCDPLVGKSACA